VLCVRFLYSSLFLLDLPATAQIYTLSLHDALPIFPRRRPVHRRSSDARAPPVRRRCPMSAGAAADRCVPPLPPARDVVVSAPGCDAAAAACAAPAEPRLRFPVRPGRAMPTVTPPRSGHRAPAPGYGAGGHRDSGCRHTTPGP